MTDNAVMASLVGVTLVTALACLILSKFSDRLGLQAIPGEHRLHEHPTPLVGGVAIYLGILLGFFLIDNSFVGLLPSLLLLCAVGAIDDKYKLPSWTRFIVQGLATYMMVRFTGVQLDTLGYLHPENETLLGRWSIPMTIFATIGVINAVNMSDGHDGLAASLLILILLSLFIAGADAGLSLITVAALVGFSIFNIRIFRARAGVFMGDAGSTMLGMLLAFLLIKHSQTEGGIWPVTALWLMALPLIDAVSVLIVRPLRGRSPFAADRIHYHHLLVDRGMSVNAMLAVVLITQAIFISLGLWARSIRIADHLQLIAFLSVFFVYILTLIWVTNPSKQSPSNTQAVKKPISDDL